jgi:SAM-dependent methyltransferase
MNNYPTENIYGHTKKLEYLVSVIKERIANSSATINLLDFGCGNGIAVSQHLIMDGMDYWGVDIHEPSLAYARNHYSSKKTRFFNEVPVDIKFDVIVYADIIEHLDDPLAILKSHVEILKDDGCMVGSIPNGFGPFELEKRVDFVTPLYQYLVRTKKKLCGQLADSEIPYNSDSGHVQFFSRSTFTEMLAKAGLAMADFRNGVLCGAPLSERILKGDKVIQMNRNVAEKLPHWAVSTWYFTATKTK